MKILLIEDNAADKLQIEALLKDYHLLWAQNSEIAMELAKKHNDIKLVIADVTLQKSEEDKKDPYAGMTVAAKIRYKNRIPVIVMTHHGREKEYMDKAKEILDIPLEWFFDKETELTHNSLKILTIVENIVEEYSNEKSLDDIKFSYRKIGINFKEGDGRNTSFISASEIAYITRTKKTKNNEKSYTQFVFVNGEAKTIDIPLKTVCEKICTVHKNFVKLGAGLCVNSDRLVKRNGTSIWIKIDNEEKPKHLTLSDGGVNDLKLEHVWITTG